MESYKRAHEANDGVMQQNKRISATLCLLVSNDHAGAVIGPKGSTLTSIRESTGCRCAVESTPTPEQERVVTVTAADVESVAAGVDSILTALFSAQNPPTAATILIAPHCVGAIIGKGGNTINSLRQSSGCDVKLQNDSVRVLNMYARCDLHGEVNVIRHAAMQISKLLFEQYTKDDAPEVPDVKSLLNPLKMNFAPPIPAYQQTLYGVPPQNLYGYTEGLSQGTHTVLEMVIPTQCLGNIIGKGGKYFNAIRESCGVELKVDEQQSQAYPGTGEPAATVLIIGGRDNVWSAAARCASNLLINSEDDAPRVEMLYLDPSAVPRVIGKGGVHINLIRSASKCKVNIDQSQQNGQMVSCVLEGRNKEIMGARMLIEARETSDDTQSTGGLPGQSTIELDVPKRVMGFMIGKSGKYINAARQATHCSIQVNEEVGQVASSHSAEVMSTITISGATNMVWTAAGHMASYLLLGKPNVEEGEGPVSEVLHVPNQHVGHIIGKQGTRIKMFRQSTGCKITIDQNDSSVAVLTLEGSVRAVLAARILVTAREIKKGADMSHPMDPLARGMIGGVPPMMPAGPMHAQPMGFGAFGGPPHTQPGLNLPMGMFGSY